VIVYDLVCAQRHSFEGWFGSADDFTSQRERELVRCPLCDDAAIARVPSANVRVGREAVPVSPPNVPASPHANASGGAPANIEAQVLAMMRKVVAQSENVGARFPEEARKIHYDEAPARSIRGQASAEEAKSLRDEGIEFAPLPEVLTRDLS
jgi:hypothetical protein